MHGLERFVESGPAACYSCRSPLRTLWFAGYRRFAGVRPLPRTYRQRGCGRCAVSGVPGDRCDKTRKATTHTASHEVERFLHLPLRTFFITRQFTQVRGQSFTLFHVEQFLSSSASYSLSTVP